MKIMKLLEVSLEIDVPHRIVTLKEVNEVEKSTKSFATRRNKMIRRSWEYIEK